MNRRDVLRLQGKQPKELMCLLHFLFPPFLYEHNFLEDFGVMKTQITFGKVTAGK